MAANNSSLQIEVVSKGIADTVRKLDMLGNAAGRNETKVKLLTDSLGKLMVAQSSAVSSAAQHAASVNLVAQAMNVMSNHALLTATQVTILNNQLSLLNNTSNNTTGALTRSSNAGSIFNSTVRAMTTAALAYLGLNFAKGIVEASDGWAMMQAKLKLATGSMQEARQVQSDLFVVSQRLRIPLDDAAKLYTRMAIPMAKMGQSAQQTANQVEYVSLALKLNGATAGEASSVMLQYSQSVNAGRLNGAEFNAVAEGAPLILRAIEAELKATAGWSALSGKTLKQMGADGEISFELMNRAAQRALPEMRKAFLELPLTVDGAIQRVKNAWFKAMGEMGETTGLGTKLAKAIGQIEQDIPKIRDALATVFLFLYDNFSKIALVVEALVAVKFIGWIGGATSALIGMAVAIPSVVAGLTATAAGVTGAATVLGTLRLALSALAGPWGILIGLVGTAAVAAWQYFGREAPKADSLVTESTRVQTVNRTLMIQKEIDKIVERNNALTKGKTLSTTVDASTPQDILKMQSDIYAREAKQRLMTDEGQIRVSKLVIAASKEHLAVKMAEIPVLAAVNKVNQDALNLEKLKGLDSQLALKVEKKPAQADREIKEWEAKYAELGKVMTEAQKTAIRADVMGKGDATEKVNHFQKLTAAIKATTAELELNIAAGDRASATEKVRIAINSGKNEDYNKLSSGDKSSVDTLVANNIALEQQIQVRDRATKATIDASAEEEKYNTKVQSSVVSINNEIDRTKLQITALTQSKTAVKEHFAAMLESDALLLESQALKELDRNGNVRLYDSLMAQASATRELAAAKVELGKGQDEKLALEELDRLLDPKKALNFGSALKEAFGDVGGAIGDMTKALGIYSKEQDALDASRKSISGLPESKLRTAGLIALDKKEEQSKLRMYGAMAGGAKDFFSEHTVAYKVLAVAEKGFRVAELAGTYANFAMKSGLLEAFTGMFVTAKATEVGVDTASQSVMLGVHTAAAATDVAVTGTTEAAKNALKIPGVMMSFLSWLGPWGMAAGGIAIAAVLGSGGGGSSSSIDFKARQANQGTGTVLGDDSAKSASINEAMTALEDNSNIGLVLTSNMLSSLRGIESSMQGLAAAIFKVSGMTTGKNFGITEGMSGGGFASSIFGGKTTTTISDTGLTLNGTSSDFSNGRGVQQYVDVNKQKSGGWFSKDKSWNERSSMAASDEITKTIGRVFGEINSTISQAAVGLGANAASIDAAMASYVISTEVSFKGLVGAELTQALNDVFSASADSIARSVSPGLDAFQRAGEGYYQTLVRVSTGTEQAENALKGFGVAMVGRESLVNKTGDIASELVRQSIMAANAGTTISDIMKVMGGSMSELIDGYKSLLAIQDTMRGAKLGSAISKDTIRGAGGVPELESALGQFVDGFYSDSEKQAISFSKLRAEFGRLNVAMPETKDGFRNLVTTLMAGDAASQELAGRVLLLGGAFADAFSVAEDARKKAIESATSDLSDAYDKESSALEDVLSKMKDFTKSLSDFRDSLIVGDLSTKSSSEKYATAKAAYEDVSARAAAGDATAIAIFEKTASDFLRLSRDVNASGINYTADYDRVLRETENLGKYTSGQVDVAKASLDLLKEQVKGLLDIKDTVLTVTAAIVALQAAMAGNPDDKLYTIDGSHANGLSNVPFNGYVAELHKGEAVLTASENNQYRANLGNFSVKSDAAMVNELKAVREELKQLREEQQIQTSSMIGAQYNSQELNAQTVVAGTKGAMEDSSYLQRTKTGLV